MDDVNPQLPENRFEDTRDSEARVNVRLHPILKLLIASVERYRGFVDTGRNTESNKEVSEENILGVLRAQVRLMEQLQTAIRQQPHPHRDALSAMADYLTLALALILRGNQWDATTIQSSTASTASTVLIRQSTLWTTVQTAADTLRIYIDAFDWSALSKTRIVHSVASCADSLPTEHPTVLPGQLDRGDACITAVLQCIDVLLMSMADAPNDDNTLVPYTAVLRIIRGCLLCLDETYSEGATQLEEPNNGGSFMPSPQLQLQALTTLQGLLRSTTDEITPTDDVNLWKRVLPGCFGVLFRLIVLQLRPSTAQASPQVTAKSMETMSLLLSTAMRRSCSEEWKSGNERSRENNVESVLRQMQALGAKRVEETVASIESSSEGEMKHLDRTTVVDEFRREVNQRLPGPLTVLLNFLPSEKSPTVRLATPNLCRCILIDTRHVWESPSSGLRQASLECCLILTMDPDERVATTARSALGEYQQQLGTREWQSHIASVVGNRVLDLLREVSVLVESQREVELRARLKLMCGYLELASTSRSSVGESIAKGTISDEIRTLLIAIFDMDFESVQFSPSVSSAIVHSNDAQHPQQYRCRFTSKETEDDARRMVRTLGSCIGVKCAALLIDALVADLFQSIVNRAESGCSRHSVSHVQWLHRWVGSVVVAHELIHGAFGNMSNLSEDSKECRRARKKMLSLCRAIFPIVTSTPLWTLPTTVDNIEVEVENSGSRGHTKSLKRLLDIGDKKSQEGYSEKNDMTDDHAVSALALAGNTVVVASLIHMMGTMVSLVGIETESFLPVLLYPLCEKTSSRNHSQIQHTSVFVLGQVAAACGVSSVTELLHLNFDYLFGSILSKIRLRRVQATAADVGQSSCPYPSDVASIVLAILGTASPGSTETMLEGTVRPKKRTLEEERNVAHVVEALALLVNRYDTAFAGTQTGAGFVPASLELVQTLQTGIDYVAFSLTEDVQKVTKSDGMAPEHPHKDPWLDLLRPFLLETTKDACEDDFEGLSPNAGFEILERNSQDNDNVGTDVSTSELNFLDLSLRRYGFMLSLPSLKVQVACCTAMDRAFQFLGFIARHYIPKEDEVNGPKTAIYRHSADVWPAIHSRLEAATSAIVLSTSKKAVSLLISQPLPASQSSVDVSTQMVFASRLFDLIASMAEVSDSFMVGRLKDYSWPIIKKVICMYLDKWNTTSSLTSEAHGREQARLQITEKDRLLWTVLGFIGRVFRHHECGANMTELIPETGAILLPFLSDAGETGSKTTEAMKAMLENDSDALWRSLVATSGQPLPPWPFAKKNCRLAAETSTPPLSMLQRRAAELMAFVESLPEQSFED